MHTRSPSPRRLARRTLIGCLASVAAIACGADATAPFETTLIPPPPPFGVDTGPLPAGRLAFTYQPADSSLRVYSVRTDGTELTMLSPPDQWAVAPTWSPDGSRVAYERTNGPTEIWTVRADGTGAMRIATDARSPFWLDDGRVGYMCPAGVCVVGADGSSPRTLLARQQPDDTFDDSFRLSPDGTTLAFVRYRLLDGWDLYTSAVYLVNLNGTLERPLEPSQILEDQRNPSWSPERHAHAYRNGWGVIDGSGPIRRVRVSLPSTRRDAPYDAWSWTPRERRDVKSELTLSPL